jgi:hypothetical protein
MMSHRHFRFISSTSHIFESVRLQEEIEKKEYVHPSYRRHTFRRWMSAQAIDIYIYPPFLSVFMCVFLNKFSPKCVNSLSI